MVDSFYFLIRKTFIVKPFFEEMGLFARPYDMFMEEVDHEKYPEIKQHYRFEKTDDRIL